MVYATSNLAIQMCADLLIFGEQDFADGGGAHPWLCIQRKDGAVWVYDPDEETHFCTELLNRTIHYHFSDSQ